MIDQSQYFSLYLSTMRKSSELKIITDCQNCLQIHCCCCCCCWSCIHYSGMEAVGKDRSIHQEMAEVKALEHSTLKVCFQLSAIKQKRITNLNISGVCNLKTAQMNGVLFYFDTFINGSKICFFIAVKIYPSLAELLSKL